MEVKPTDSSIASHTPLDPTEAARVLSVLQAPEAESFCGPDLPALPEYRIERKLGSGGSGDVFLARREGSDRLIALKMIRHFGESAGGTGRREKVLNRAIRELQFLEEARLPCLPRLLDYGTHDGRLYLAVEYIEGRPLDGYCEAAGMTLRERADVLASVCDAVQSLHEKGIIHRDLKPSNVLVTASGDVMLIDLGIAALAARTDVTTLTEDGCPIGTPAFMSPEQARGDKAAISTRCDVYSLGATGYALLAGAPPHATNTSIADMIRRVSFEQPRDAREIDPSLPRPLSAVLLKSVALRQQDRYASAADLGADLRRWAGGEVVEALRPSGWTKIARWGLRNPRSATLGVCALIVISIITGLAGFSRWLSSRVFYVVAEPDRRTYLLFNGLQVPVGSWIDNATMPEGWPSAVRLESDAQGNPVLITRLVKDPDSDLADRVCLWRPDRLAAPFWKSPRYPAFPPTVHPHDASRPVSASLLIIADVFPDIPGNEIIVKYSSSEQPCGLFVYSLAGQQLFEVWHYGDIANAAWLEDQHLLVLAGHDNSKHWSELGTGTEFVGAEDDHVKVLVAITPEIHGAWGVLSPGDGGPGHPAAWTRWLVTPGRKDLFYVASLHVYSGRLDDACLGVMVEPRVSPQSANHSHGVEVLFDRSGRPVSAGPSDEYEKLRASPTARQGFGLPSLPSPEDLQQSWLDRVIPTSKRLAVPPDEVPASLPGMVSAPSELPQTRSSLPTAL